MANEMSVERILADYKSSRQNYKALVSKLEQLLKELLRDHNIVVHSISGRAKSRKSLAGKLVKNDSNYENLTDLTDLAGLRIITYFSEDVDRVAEIIKGEFDIDLKNSVDKRRSLAADRFGYLSRHQVFSLKDSRCELTEYKPFKGMKTELQIRSILQHAWAEIEHDLGYKSEIEVPQHIRRRFALVAGLLEISDKEFESIKNELEEYREEVSTDVQKSSPNVPLNLDSMRAFIGANELVKSLDNRIAEIIDGHRLGQMDNYISSLLPYMELISVKDINTISSMLKEQEEIIVAFTKHWFRDNAYNGVADGISIFYLWLIAIGNKDKKELESIFEDEHFSNVKRLARELPQAIAKARAELQAK